MKIQAIKTSKIEFCSLSGVFFWLFISSPVIADIIPDTTLPNNSTVRSEGNTRVIEGGTPRDQNLFHSFKEFSFSANTADITGDTAYFNNDAAAVRNIITRITGGSPSSIDGLIKANGSANLFFINPAGIIFGQNASLQIGGSFVASTADSLKFADGTEFSATSIEPAPLLTVSIPIGLQFRNNPGDIVNQSQASLEDSLNTISSPAGLQVASGKTLALVGGNVSLLGGNLTALNGRIELGSVDANSFVSLNEIDTSYALGYENVQKFRDIQLSGGAQVDTSGDSAGVIQVQGKNITLTDYSLIFSIALGSQPGGNLIINAAESVKLSGGSNIITLAEGEEKAGDIFVKASDSVELEGTSPDGRSTFIGSQVCLLSECGSVTGNGGNVTIETRKLFIRDGAIIDASTFGIGNAGNILIKASEFVDVIGTSSDGIPSGIFAQVAEGAIDNPGNAGTLTIDTKKLTVQGGAQISTAGRKTGNGGNMIVNATDSVLLSGASQFATGELFDKQRSGLFVSAEPGATGNVGSLNLTTGLLTVEDGARISADNFGSGLPGTSTLNVRQLIIKNGGEVKSGSFSDGDGGTLIVNASESIDIFGTGTIAGNTIASTLSSSSQADASGRAGNLIINTPIFNVRDGAEVSVSAKGTGAAGNLTVKANTIRLNQGKLTAETNAGEGANIRLQNVDLLLMQNQSLISARALNDASGGNIDIDAANGLVVAFPDQNNDIVANAFQGKGGEIKITTKSIFGLEERPSTPPNTTNDIDASSEFGLAGDVILNTPDVDHSRGLIELPETVVDPTQQIAQSPCQPGTVSSFIITGRGGLPSSPNESFKSDNIRIDLVEPTASSSKSQIVTINQPITHTHTKRVIPAQGWVLNGKGEVVLTAYDPTTTSLPLRAAKATGACSASSF
ncbi:filamentous hemagglutinin N-terminal domain-containing protein [Chlorogloeopsis fritschii PCC 9212]|uniref:Filamentous haemagglutinin FhaB/tRNA nuclease CdiA-like TPS domain-containing protein n=1 Tax=Chlorogloeopsis fritschii PCC 6912 TaxID=211165 RepID=A0A3S0ZME5_CHLFR|nr:S-layer family protein [Chlorogloeopsis fritschii]RUR79185.1 hypothetical protein PCC6912_33590 [Chlorogloeopsis fritschii PCC 6912]